MSHRRYRKPPLTDRERLALRLRFDERGEIRHTYQEIAATLGVTYGRANQLVNRARSRLNTALVWQQRGYDQGEVWAKDAAEFAALHDEANLAYWRAHDAGRVRCPYCDGTGYMAAEHAQRQPSEETPT